MLRKYFRKFILIYLNNIIIYFKTFEEYKQHVQLVFEALWITSLMIKSKKYKFAQKELWFLEHIISADRISINPEKITKMVALPLSINLKELRSRLGLFSYYQ